MAAISVISSSCLKMCPMLQKSSMCTFLPLVQPSPCFIQREYAPHAHRPNATCPSEKMPMEKNPTEKMPTEKMPIDPTRPNETIPIEKKPMPSALEQLTIPADTDPAEKYPRDAGLADTSHGCDGAAAPPEMTMRIRSTTRKASVPFAQFGSALEKRN